MSYKKIFTIAALAALILVSSFSVNSAFAADKSPTDPFSCSFSNGMLTCALSLVTMATVWVLKLVISLGALLVQVGLQINSHIYDSPIVLTGFSVSLAVANLGFVLVIIVIALATILRNQTYGVKQLLWKLVLMAILVNFGLVVTRPIVSFADGLTGYFINQISGGTTQDIGAFTTKVVAAFNPQALSASPAINANDIAKDASCAVIAGASPIAGAGALCQVLGSLVSYIASDQSSIFVKTFLASVFMIFFGSIIAFVFLVLSILLLVRYVYLAIYLVLLPFAWLMWVVPKFSSEFSKWWNNFIKWTLFPPCALFFIYLSLATITTASYLNSALPVVNETSTAVNVAQQPMGGIFTMTGLGAVVQQFADELVLAGLMIGGLFASSALCGKAGAMAVTAGKTTAGWVGGYAGKRTRQAATAPLRGEGARNIAAKLQQPTQNRFLKYSGIGKVGQWGGRLMASGAAAGGEQTIAKGKAAIKNDTPELNRQKISTTSSAWTRIARIGKAVDDKQVGENIMTTEEQESYFGRDKEALFKRYGPEGEEIYKKARDASGIEQRDLLKDRDKSQAEFERVEKSGGDSSGAVKKVDEIEAKLTALHKRMSENNPEVLADQLQDPDKYEEVQAKARASGKPLPAALSMKKEDFEKRQDSIIRSVPKFSPSNFSGMTAALSKNGNLPGFDKAIERMKKSDTKGFEKLHDDLIKNNQNLLRYSEKNSGKTLGIDIARLFNVQPGEIISRTAKGTTQQQQRSSSPTSISNPPTRVILQGINRPKGPQRGPSQNQP